MHAGEGLALTLHNDVFYTLRWKNLINCACG